jgi:hypothetical protein
MIRKLTLAIVLVSGLMLPACSDSGGPAEFCNSMVDHLISVCDPTDDAAALEAFIAAMEMPAGVTVDMLFADNGALAKTSCTTGFEDVTWNQDEADIALQAIEATTTCETALTAVELVLGSVE